MRNITLFYVLIIAGIIIIPLNSCKKDNNDNNPAHILITTAEVSGITRYSVITGGIVSYDDSLSITTCGVCWSKDKPGKDPLDILDNITSDTLKPGGFISFINGLNAGDEYYVRAYVTYKTNDVKDSLSTAYGKVLTFTTIQEKVITAAVSEFSQNSVTCGGIITSEFGTVITARGICWNTTGDPTVEGDTTLNGAEPGGFTSIMKGLQANTAYFIRAYGRNDTVISYGQEIMVKTQSNPVTDIDGNIYNTVGIGSQVWMIENLKTTHFRDGSEIPLIEGHVSWDTIRLPGYCWYFNEELKYKDKYGALYNWYTINSGEICPAGWHVPTDTDWLILINTFGGEFVAGDKLKESGTEHWPVPNIATNETGFTGRPGGGRNFAGTFDDAGMHGYWWSSSEFAGSFARYIYLRNDTPDVSRAILDKRSGLSVRCVED